ncbi:heme-binding domain-containing protein [Sediminibacterium ginsengisoli]|uniref:Haem-binding domain-containing protein n=1 Tax=Sediminibacterium ginsengisoli TaxID=413434 RepID=A0A1T4RQZ9_9BACT|nr:heme-binding domain-containing protein [Sediminibacterium ginsengisoli]SKA18373.1 Haem-binding domain-containing protein [Sediminibacterium ginsengisoli]
MIKKILILLLTALIVIQFFRPQKNIASGPSANAIEKHFTVPAGIYQVLKRSCYDCHSNNTVYPWYNNFQPVAWLIAKDVKDGKRHFNFDEFNAYPNPKKKHKLEEFVDEIKDDKMPPGIYTVIHRNAVLSAGEKQQLIAWADSLQKSIN